MAATKFCAATGSMEGESRRMMGSEELQRQLEFLTWVETASAMIVSNAQARAVRMELINHYQEHRQEREGAGWPPSEAHRAAMDQLGSSLEAQKTWACHVGIPDALPWTLGFLTVALQVIAVFGWHWGIYLSWITAGFAIVTGGRRLKETVVTISRYWLMQWRKFPTTMKLVGGLVGFIVGFEPVWAGEPIWNGHTLDVLLSSWPIPVGVIILSTLTWTTAHTVNHMKTSPMAASSQVGGGAALGLVMGGSLGFGTTWTWLLVNVIPPKPGTVGYLPHWPWQAVSYTLSTHLAPGITILVAWVMLVGAIAGRFRVHQNGEPVASD